MKKVILSLILALGLAACGEKAETPQENEKPVVKIGAIFPLSGDSAESGEYARDAAIMALEDAKKNNLKYDYKILIEDDQFKSNITAMVANKFINKDKVNAIVTYYAPAGFIVKPLARKYGFLHLGNTWEAKVADGDYTFTQFAMMPDMINVGVEYLAKTHIKKVAIISEIRATSEEFATEFSQALNNVDIETTLNTFNRGERDFRLLIQKLKRDGYNYFLVNSIKPEFDVIVKQLHEAGVENDNIMGTCGELTPPKELYEGIVFPGTTIGSTNFSKRYKKRFGRSPNYTAVISYDLVTLMVRAFEHNYVAGQLPENEKVLTYVKTLKKFPCEALMCEMTSVGHIRNPANLRKCINQNYILLKN